MENEEDFVNDGEEWSPVTCFRMRDGSMPMPLGFEKEERGREGESESESEGV